MSKKRVEVVIDGQIITLVSDEKEGHMQQLALYIDKKMTEIKSSRSSNPISDSLKSLYISVNIADDYFKTKHKLEKMVEKYDGIIVEMSQMQQEKAVFNEKIHELQAKLNYQREQYLAESAQLQEENDDMATTIKELQEQLSKTKKELDEFLDEFSDSDERKNVVNFSSKVH